MEIGFVLTIPVGVQLTIFTRGYKRFRHFGDGEDYREIGKDDPLVKFYEKKYSKVRSPDLPNIHNTKYYTVTSECFKMIGMMRNNDIRRYYIKIEQLARVMIEYIQSIQDRALETKDKALESKDRALESKDKVLESI